jgi:site-specific recombinase XerD
LTRFVGTLAVLFAGPPLRQQVAGYLVEIAGRNASHHTLAAYKSDLSRFVAWLESREPPVTEVLHLTREHCIDWTLSMREAGFASATVARRYAAMRSWLMWLALRQKIPAALDLPVNVRRDPPPIPNIPAVEAVSAMIATCDRKTYCGARDRAILEFLYSTGCRASELCGLGLEAISHDRRIARVLGKGRKERLVVLGTDARTTLRTYLDEWRRPARDPRWAQRVFLTRDGTGISTRNLHKIVARAARAAGITGAHPHTLRHCFASHMVDDGANVAAVQEMLGHASLATTQRYVHISKKIPFEQHRMHHPRGDRAKKPPEEDEHAASGAEPLHV